MREMNRRVAIGTALTLLAGLGAAAAQPMGPGMGRGMGPGGGGGPAFGRGLTDPASYLAGLKAELGITAAQEPAWTEYAQTVEGVAGQMRAMHTSVYESMPTATWQERRDMMDRMFDSRDEARRIVRDAAQKLLPSLTEAQRAKATGVLPGLMMPRGRGPGGRWGGATP